MKAETASQKKLKWFAIALMAAFVIPILVMGSFQ